MVIILANFSIECDDSGLNKSFFLKKQYCFFIKKFLKKLCI